MGPDQQGLVARYDALMFSEPFLEYGDRGDFANYGWWDPPTTSQKRACEQLMERLMACVPEKTGTLLDVACGKGATTRYLTKWYRPEQLTGINISERQLASARQAVPGASFHLMDATRLEFPDATFDTVVCVEAAFHFDTRADFLREAYRVLRPGGRLVVTDILMTREAERSRSSFTEKNHLPNPTAYTDVCRAAGFVDVRVEDVIEQCWRGCFRNVVRFAHEKFLRREIDRATLETVLEPSYTRVGEIVSYLRGAMRRPA